MTGCWAASFDLFRLHHPVFRNPQNLQLASRNAVLRPFLARGGLRFPVSAQRHRLQVLFSAPVSGGKNPVPNSTFARKCGRRRGGRHVGRKRVVCGPAHSATTLRLICRERHESSSRSAPHSVQTLVAMTCFIKRLPSLTDAIEFQKLRQYRSSISESAS